MLPINFLFLLRTKTQTVSGQCKEKKNQHSPVLQKSNLRKSYLLQVFNESPSGTQLCPWDPHRTGSPDRWQGAQPLSQ